MIFLYKVYKKSTKATVINVLVRLIAWFMVIPILAIVFHGATNNLILDAILVIVCIGIAIKIIFLADDMSDTIAGQDFIDEMETMVELVPDNIEDLATLPPTLSEASTITFSRDHGLEAYFIAIEYCMNGQSFCKLRRGESVTVTTMQTKNVFCAKYQFFKSGKLGEPIELIVNPGEHVRICYSGFNFKKVYRD